MSVTHQWSDSLKIHCKPAIATLKGTFLWFHESQPRKPKRGQRVTPFMTERNRWMHARWCFTGIGISHQNMTHMCVVV